MESARGPEHSPSAGSSELLVTIGGYVLLFAVGVLQGLIGTFQYNRALGSFPIGAVAFAVLIGLTSSAGAWGMHRPLGGLLPAAGWFIASFVLAMATPGGSVLITNTSAGQWFLFGGSLCAAAGVVAGFVFWSPRRLAAASPPDRPRLFLVPSGCGSSAASAVNRGAPEPELPGADARKPES